MNTEGWSNKNRDMNSGCTNELISVMHSLTISTRSSHQILSSK